MSDFNDRQTDLLQELNKSTLNDFKGYQLEKLLFNKVGVTINLTNGEALREIIKRLVCNFFEISGVFADNHILLVSYDYNRNDHNNAWSKFKSLFKEYDEINIKGVGFKKSNLISICTVLQSLYKLIVYFIHLKNIKKFKFRALNAAYLVELWRLKWILESYNINSCVMAQYFDGNPYENLIAQQMELKGVKTVTLQHGQPVFHGFNTDYLNQSIILNFSSNYIALPGQFAKKQFMKANVPEEKLVIVGSLREILPLKLNKSKFFTIFLDCPMLPNAKVDNLKLIDVSEHYAKSHGYKYCIKCHPQDTLKNYEDINISYGTFCHKKISIEESLRNAEFAVLHASGVYLDILAMGIKAFCLVTETNFPLVEYNLDLFNDVHELGRLLDVWSKMEDSKKHKYFTDVVDYYLSPEKADERNHRLIMNLIDN